MRVLVIQNDIALPLGPIGERFADDRYGITPVRSNFVNGGTELPVRVLRTPEVEH
jgi:hypothetical protein